MSTGKYVAPAIVARLKMEMPEIEVRLKVANRSATIEALERGEYDLCIMRRPPNSPAVHATPLVDHPHVIVAAVTHPLTHKHMVTPEELLGELFVMREDGSGTQIHATRYLDEIGHGREVKMAEWGPMKQSNRPSQADWESPSFQPTRWPMSCAPAVSSPCAVQGRRSCANGICAILPIDGPTARPREFGTGFARKQNRSSRRLHSTNERSSLSAAGY
ncbi:LysR substrate-binding domain-containing protein [Mesorhizobium carmichaelinearum]|uniref:LysR substrate-binding domain-containing protein n=1 Tax=Mesorhizobium carmichaelinearum TaxID=1208188 RepID=UPI001FCE84DE|nr:LysR substrate-binding domain-containing protein [Mesorhizobium carmichaelinearum]